MNGIFTTPATPGVLRWETLFTPYNPGKGTPNLAGTFEARAFVPLPISLAAHVSYVKKTNTWLLSGTASEGGLPLSGLAVKVARGLSATALAVKSSTKTGASGSWKTSGKLKPKKTTYFKATASAGRARLHGAGVHEPTAGDDRTRRLRHGDALALVGEERRGQVEALTREPLGVRSCINVQGLTPPFRIGTCSWADEALSKYFYPPKLPAKERLAYYAELFDTVEVDSTYYRLPASRWCRAGPTARRPASRCT